MFSKKKKFSSVDVKAYMKMAYSRIDILLNKTRNEAKVLRREIAGLLEKGKEASGRIKVERVIQNDNYCEALELIQMYCDVVSSRASLLDTTPTICPNELSEAICTLLYASVRVEMKELSALRDVLERKYGKPFIQNAIQNRNLCVNTRVVYKLSVVVPEAILCVEYLRQIAEEFDISYEPSQAVYETNLSLDPYQKQQQQQPPPQPGFQQPPPQPGYQQPPPPQPGFQQPPPQPGYQQPPPPQPGYQQPPPQPQPGFQQPPPQPGYEQPPPPQPGFQQPPPQPVYEQPPPPQPGYEQPQPGYEQPQPGFQQPPPQYGSYDYEAPPPPAAPTGVYVQSPSEDTPPNGVYSSDMGGNSTQYDNLMARFDALKEKK